VTRPHTWHDDAHLGAVLTSVGEHLVLPDAQYADVAEPAHSAGRHRRIWPALAVAAAVLVVIGVVVAPVREAVAGWLGIGSTRIERVPPDDADPAGLPPLHADLAPATQREATRVLGAPLPEVTDPRLSEPEVIATPAEGGAILAWDHGSTTLWVQPAGAEAGERTKRVPLARGGSVENVAGLGEEALVVEGGHVLITPGRRAAAGTVLLWTDGGFEYRLESDLDRQTMISLARSVRGGS
jgi:hypothetical protein